MLRTDSYLQFVKNVAYIAEHCKRIWTRRTVPFTRDTQLPRTTVLLRLNLGSEILQVPKSYPEISVKCDRRGHPPRNFGRVEIAAGPAGAPVINEQRRFPLAPLLITVVNHLTVREAAQLRNRYLISFREERPYAFYFRTHVVLTAKSDSRRESVLGRVLLRQVPWPGFFLGVVPLARTVRVAH